MFTFFKSYHFWSLGFRNDVDDAREGGYTVWEPQGNTLEAF